MATAFDFRDLSQNLSATQAIAVTMRVALEHHERGELHQAAHLYREVLGVDAAHADASYLLALIAIAENRQPAAVQLLRTAVRNRPRAANMHRTLAELLMRMGRTAAALHCYWRILSLEPHNPIAFVDVGDVLTKIKADGGNDDAAASSYRRALNIDADCARAHLGLGHIHRRAGAVGGIRI
jgi:tetratricopeptide (TPR) repeat protein